MELRGIRCLAIMGLVVAAHALAIAVAGEARLNNDAKYAARVRAVERSRPGPDADPGDVATYWWSLAGAKFLNRDYAGGEAAVREALKLLPRHSPLYCDLSVQLGKQGKYEDALHAARKALGYGQGNARDTMHAELVLACWEWESGKHEEARKRVAYVSPPRAGSSYELLYYGSLAGFYAITGEEAKLEAAVKKTLHLDKENQMRPFFERDVSFDPYRAKPWFVALVGQTLE